MKASEIVRAALRRLGVYASGEQLTAAEQQDGLMALNQILDGWALQRLMVYRVDVVTVPLVSGQSVYTIPAPAAIRQEVRLYRGDDYSNVLLVRDLAGKPDQYGENLFGLGFDHPEHIAYSVGTDVYTFTLSDSTFATSMQVDTLNLPENLTANTDLNLPKGYDRALITALAIEVAPEYGQQVTDALMMQYRNAMAIVQRANRAPILARPDATLMAMSRGCHSWR
jgi:hypothetical protein